MANLPKSRDAKPRSKWPIGHMMDGLPRLIKQHRKGKPVEGRGTKLRSNWFFDHMTDGLPRQTQIILPLRLPTEPEGPNF